MPSKKGDIFDQVAGSPSSGGDIFDRVAGGQQPSAQGVAGLTGPLPGVPGIQKPDLNYVPAIDSPKHLLTGAVAGVKNMVQHPAQAAASMGQPFAASGMAPGGMYPSTMSVRPQDQQANQQIQNDALTEQGKQGNYIAAHPMEAIGNVAGQTLLTAGVAKGLKTGLPALGEAMENTGVGVMNKTAGALKNDFKRGANPGRAYLDAGGGAALSMDSLAGKAADLKDQTGGKLESVYDQATRSGVKIPVKNVTSALRAPIQEARSVVTGPGGTGDVAPIRQFGASFAPPIQKAVAEGGFSPNDLWAVKKNVSKNTNWSDPTQVGMKSLRQETAGALGGTLTDAVEEAKPLNAQYQGLTNFANRAGSRALTHSSPLTSLFGKAASGAMGAAIGSTHGPTGALVGGLVGTAADSVPIKSALAKGLYSGGRSAVAVGRGLRGLYGFPVLTTSGNR